MIDSEKNNQKKDKKTKKSAGLLVPLFAIREENDLGIGDTKSLIKFLDWVKKTGFSFLQLLPINETSHDNSPYNSLSSCAIEPTTIHTHPSFIDDLSEENYDETLSLIKKKKTNSQRVDYQSVRHIKMILLNKAFNNFWNKHYITNSKENKKFKNFCTKESNWLLDYCIFKYLMDEEGGTNNWSQWNKSYSEITKAKYIINAHLDKKNNKDKNTEKKLAFYAYIQYIANQQWTKVAQYAREIGVKLMGDIPFGINYYSIDFFSNPQFFIHDWYGGAPPETNFNSDEFTKKWGQNWGIPIYHWREMKKNNYQWWKQRISKTIEFFDMFRIDHALGFFRIYAFPWKPEENDNYMNISDHEVWEKTKGRLPKFLERSDESPSDSEKNRISGEEILTMIKKTAKNAEIIAEDLGFVPNYVRPSLKKIGISGMLVPQWEKTIDQQLTLINSYEENTFAIYTSHDHEAIGVQWNNARKTIIESNDTEAIYHAKEQLKSLFELSNTDLNELKNPPEYSEKINDQLIKSLLESNSRYVCFNFPDLLCSKEKFNTPGTVNDQNWSQRLHVTTNELLEDENYMYKSAKIKLMISDSGRIS